MPPRDYIRITSDTITPLLRETRRKISSGSLLRLALARAARETRENFTSINDRRSPTSRFYAKEGRNRTRTRTTSPTTGEVIVASYKMAHKYYGGTVRPSRTRFLAIPHSEEARHREPRKYGAGKHSPLFFVPRAYGGLLFDGRTRGHPRLAYILVRRVRHRSRHDVLPTERRLQSVVEAALRDYL